MRVLKKILKTILDTITSWASRANATSSGSVFNIYANAILECDPKKHQEVCKEIGFASSYITFCSAWLDLVIKSIGAASSNARVKTVINIWDGFVNLASTHAFYTQLELFLYTVIQRTRFDIPEDQDVDMDNWLFGVLSVITLGLALLSNPDIRKHVTQHKFFDGFFGFFTGFSIGRGVIASIHGFSDIHNSTNTATYSPEGIRQRFIVGGISGLYSAFVSVKYSPQTTTSDLAELLLPLPGTRHYAEIVRNSLLAVMSAFFFSYFTANSIYREDDPKHKLVHIIGFCLLASMDVLQIFLRNFCFTDENDSELVFDQPNAPHLDEGPDSEPGYFSLEQDEDKYNLSTSGIFSRLAMGDVSDDYFLAEEHESSSASQLIPVESGVIRESRFEYMPSSKSRVSR